jgi:hypothetical protein
MSNDDFDIDSFLAEGQPAQQAPAPSAGNSDFDIDAFLGATTDQATGESKPKYADGLGPDRPINKSPVDIVDRLRYSLGNVEGVKNDLKGKFKEVVQDPKGNFVIKHDDGMWYRADPKGLGDGDAWERTKELLGDTADVVPGAVKGAITGFAATKNRVGALVGAVAAIGGDAYSEEISDAVKNNPKKAMAAAATLGLVGATGVVKGAPGSIKGQLPAVAAGAVAEGVRTSLGRMVGTYEATPQQQLKDIGLEAMLNLGGATIAAGVKPTASMLASAAKNLKNAPQASKEMMAVAIGGTTGVEPGNVLTTLNNGGMVAQTFARFKAASLGAKEFAEKATEDSVKWVKHIAEKAQPTLNRIWSKGEAELLNGVDDTFHSTTNNIVSKIYSGASAQGVGQYFKTVNGKKVIMDAADVDAHFAKNAHWPEGVQFELKPRAVLVNEQKSNGIIKDVINDPDAYNLLQDFMRNVRQFQGMKVLTGKEGAKQMLKFNKIIDDQTYKLTQLGKDQSIPGIAKAMSDTHQLVRGNVMVKFDKLGPNNQPLPNAFQALNDQYSEAKNAILPVLRANNTARQAGDPAYEQFLKQVTNSRNVMKKDGLGKLVKMASENGDDSLEQAFDRIAVNEAAKSWSPWFSSGKVTAALAGGATVAATTGNPVPAMLAAGAAVATSPRTIFAGIRGAQGAASMAKPLTDPAMRTAQTAAAAGFKGLDFLKQRTPEQIKTMVNDPKILGTFFNSVSAGTQAHQQVRDQLVQEAIGRSEPIR